ncbi:hypothetical protein SOVF_080940 [Spinacia oleracea]|nr:hypothetical protein SOVF_080940 [Spinacia oleracea]
MGSEKVIKSNFNQTCNRFSQFLKERRSFGQLDAFKTLANSSSEIDIKGVKDGGINVFAKNMEKERVSLELFPLMSSLVPTDSRKSSISNEESKNTASTPSMSMTIFYGGRVVVFDEFPQDKALEIMSLAKNGTMSSHSQIEIESQTPNNIVPTHLTQGVVSKGMCSLYDLPIARRVSLHRFMEKRKHRIAASAPYQLQHLSSKKVDSHTQKSDIMRSLYEH